jgi:hypothetical protein
LQPPSAAGSHPTETPQLNYGLNAFDFVELKAGDLRTTAVQYSVINHQVGENAHGSTFTKQLFELSNNYSRTSY